MFSPFFNTIATPTLSCQLGGSDLSDRWFGQSCSSRDRRLSKN
ncbi:MAG: hypothetical protein ACTS3T_19970 [Almyronema sp.]|uniref:Uncharacterized protein n=1 Tax=Almyronema epifaneia S1 TaxID=2991925 RepID=A0ABW6IAK9_9CYAN